jgi:hypothetical protein
VGDAGFNADLRPPADTLRGQISALAYLGQRMILPIDQGIDPDPPIPLNWAIPLAFRATVLTAIAGLAWIIGQTRPWWRLALAWAVVALWSATALQSPKKARVWNNLGYALTLEGRSDQAASAYHRALVLDPDYAKARASLDALQPPPP